MSQVTQDTETNNGKKSTISVDLVKLRSLVQTNMSEDRYGDFKLILNSLIDRQEYAKYHYREYRRIIDSKNNIYKQMTLVIAENNNDYWDKIGIRANALACIQNLHVVHDILAHLITYALDLKFKDERRITLKNVHSKIQENTDYSSIDNLLVDLIENDNFKYMVANVNHSKHKYNIEPSITVSPQKEPSVTCSFSQFSFHGIVYPEKDTDNFFKTEFNRELKLILYIENELIDILNRNVELEIER